MGNGLCTCLSCFRHYAEKKLLIIVSILACDSRNFKDFKFFAKVSNREKTITFIPTASLVEDYKDYVVQDKIALEKLGFHIDVLDIASVAQKTIMATIQYNQYIYISGGNTFYLQQELKKSGADKIITQAIKTGKPYIGASAGSIIVSPNIHYIAEMDDMGKVGQLTDYQGLNLISFYPLPHYTNEPFIAITEKIIKAYQNKLNLIPISNTQAIMVIDDSVTIIGEGIG